jgi:hypothetical protein
MPGLQMCTTFPASISAFTMIYFAVEGIEPRVSHMLGKCSTMELHPSPHNDSLKKRKCIPIEG